jgi:hypothetical protein
MLMAHSSKEYMRDFRRKQEQKKAVIEEMTFKGFGDLEHSWCVKARMDAGDSEEGAKCYCDGNREEIKRMIASDMEEKSRQNVKVETMTTEDRSNVQSPIGQDFEKLLAYCTEKRYALLKRSETRETAEKYCDEMLNRSDVDFTPFLRQQMRENGEWPDKDVSQEYIDRVYVDQAVYGIPQNYAEGYIKTDMIREGKFADLAKRVYNRESIGDLYGKTRAEISAMDSKTIQRSRTTVGDLFGKSRKQILDSGGEPQE